MNTPNTLTSESTESELTTLERELATSVARSDLECLCNRESHDGGDWYVTDSAAEEDREDLLRALRYLALRDLLEKHPEQPRLVRLVS